MKREFLVELEVTFELETSLGFSDCKVVECCCQEHMLRDIGTVERFVTLYKKAISNKKIRLAKIRFFYCYFNPHIESNVFLAYADDTDKLTVKQFQKTYLDVADSIIHQIEQWEVDGINFVA